MNWVSPQIKSLYELSIDTSYLNNTCNHVIRSSNLGNTVLYMDPLSIQRIHNSLAILLSLVCFWLDMDILTWYKSPLIYSFKHKRSPDQLIGVYYIQLWEALHYCDQRWPIYWWSFFIREISPLWSSIYPRNSAHFFEIFWSSEVGHSLQSALVSFVQIVFIKPVQNSGLSSFLQNSS